MTHCIEHWQDSIKSNWESTQQRVPWRTQLDLPKNNDRNAKHTQKKGEKIDKIEQQIKLNSPQKATSKKPILIRVKRFV